ncbi:DNA polymerase epsilon, catalytic subunit a, putative [Plasmodium knowlesi strain H]|uniref:DNA-directed DNA polymerase n=3 Tax=Plasmodium knowlesi TaxID=5850 RepID=A0A5K1UG89_PLAKH|nr:DNA polymerase epsilon catalytic subunit A, putative [Plasmodium knowlesi strain H]OTN64330.1 putative DNA polymerase epsilon - catalytic subunit a [Plasmodium knowlesi]CAA9989020.1 DNA polymerase epsilon catalytic subunit A, putative [Plasmodium knowlesi strain H]SBO24864.1 DNA polymerase epsilon, catalytic subunit a, putative [Plasmodium knowlesi strain H]SBO27556.1 DNA polymerase epsilon, catalytic subunit a, putative [Plasmodium knowlesi strain H]VVS78494.1 DNA polymerase epsilon cataly|eukprot:XP_002261368.1 DNA polymerase epsilon, catalytic subunit,putative [Plasmodium knowlesi strain H]
MTTQARTKGWERDSKVNADYEYERLIKLENKFNIKPWLSKGQKEGYLYNIVPTVLNVVVKNSNKSQKKTGVHMYFVSDNNKTWRLTMFYRPYFYLKTKNIHNYEAVTKYLRKELDKYNVEIDYVKKEDLSLYDHLNKKRSYLSNIFFKLSFDTIENLLNARDFISKIIERNKKNKERNNTSNADKHIFNEFEYELSQSKLDFSYKHDTPYNKYDQTRETGVVTKSEVGNAKREEQRDPKKTHTFNNNTGDLGGRTKKNDAHVTVSTPKLNMNEIIINTKKQILSKEEILQEITEIYEYDVKYTTRICIDQNIRCGLWYRITRDEDELYTETEAVHFEVLNKKVLAPLNVLAWDIECYKDELKFPDKEKDEIILISYMYNAQGYLIVNRNVMSKNIREFLYKPNEEYSGAGTFKIFNEQNEYFLLKRFLEHIRILKIHIFVTYNGDFFDIPYLFRRCEINNLSVPKEIGFIMNYTKQECACNFILNIDAYKWVERDSYLPNGSRTLKSVCKIKLKYNPTEVDPELMVSIAKKNPQHLAVYSVSDAVATFYLYDKFIHNFLFALCSIIPMNPDNVLRQGSGTLCEQLLMAEAYKKNILFPNKFKPAYNQYFTDVESKKKYFIYDDSFVGGTVQSLKCGIYRDDLKEHFNLDVDTYKYLVENVDNIIDFWVQKDLNKNCSPSDPKYINKNQIINLKQIKNDIIDKLNFFIHNPSISICPNIYHLDVAAMYPNIILSHRLQPNAIVTQDHCFNCSFYKQRHLCQKQMVWKRKLEISPIDYGHVLSLMQDLKTRLFYPQKSYFKMNNKEESDSSTNENSADVPLSKKKSWNELTEKQQHDELMIVIKECSQRVFKKTKVAKEVDASSLVCQRENPFYVDTVRTFRDRRYVYKKGLKECEHEKKELLKAKKIDYMKIQELDDKILLNDSLQLAHKCILNSFYGYVKRKSSRWYSDQMGAIVTYTGSQIINGAFNLINKIGIPVELDTDGIWCMLPKKFPEIYDMYIVEKSRLNNMKEYEDKTEEELKNDASVKKVEFEFPTNILNFEMHKKWTNHQYLIYNENTDDYECISKNEIFFELDGPWHGMFLPASEKSDELLKKRYVVFNDKYKISELKGFEIKRRGELRIIQKFQSEIFNHFLKGKTKEESYYYASLTANKWKNLIDSKAVDIDNDDELFDLILAKKVLNKSVKEQPNAKSFGITTAKRLSELLCNTSYVEDNNVSTQFIVASKPIGSDITFRAIPIQIFKTNVETQIHYLGKWLGVTFPPDVPVNVRDIIDWDYYKQKLEVQILKLVIIPAIKQNINNPITSISVPEWLKKQINISEGKQKKITAFFVKKNVKKECISNDEANSSTPLKGEMDEQENEKKLKVDDPSLRSLEKKSPFQVDATFTAMNISSESLHKDAPPVGSKKRSLDECLLENFISKRKKLGQLHDNSMAALTHGNSGSMIYKKVNSFDNYLDNNNVIIINHEKISNLKYTELLEIFQTDFKKWMQINSRIWKNNRSQIRKIRNEDKSKRKKYPLGDEEEDQQGRKKTGANSLSYHTDVDDEKNNSQKLSKLEPKYLHSIQNAMDIVHLYKKVKRKKVVPTPTPRKGKHSVMNPSSSAGGGNSSNSPINNPTKNEKQTLLKPYLEYFKHETESDSSSDEGDIFSDRNVIDENDDDGIYYAIVSLKNMNKFYKIKIQIYRHIYINNYDPLDIKSNNKITIKLVSSSGSSNSPGSENIKFHANAFAHCFLPRNVKIFNLYEFIMSERYFNRYVVNTLNANYHESIVSVYETKIPLYFDFLSRYGNSVEIDSNNYNSIFDENKCFKSHCFSRVEKNKLKNVSLDYLDDVHFIYIHIFHTLVNNVCNRIFVGVYDQFEENSDDQLFGCKLMFSGVGKENDSSFDPYEVFFKFTHLEDGTSMNNAAHSTHLTGRPAPNQRREHLIDKNFFIKNVPRDFLFLYHYRKFETYFEDNTNVYKVLEHLDIYLNKYRGNMLTGKKKYIFYVSSTIDKNKLGWWSTNKYFPCYFYKFENAAKYQNVSRISYKKDAFNLSLQLFYDNYHKVEEDLNFSRISNIPLFNLLNVNKKNQKHKFIYDTLYASFLKKYKGILWLSYFGHYDLGIPCLNINNFCDYDLVKKNNDIINQGIYRGYIVHLFFNESLIFNSVRLFTKYANVKASTEYYHSSVPRKNTHIKKGDHRGGGGGTEHDAAAKWRHRMKYAKQDYQIEDGLDEDDMSTTDDNYNKLGGNAHRKGKRGMTQHKMDDATKRDGRENSDNEWDDDMEGEDEENNLSNLNEKKNIVKNKYDINTIVEQNSHVSQFSNHAFKILGKSLEYLISKISSLSMLITNKTFESISEIFTSFYSWVSNNSSLLYDVALYNKVLECTEIYQNNLINIMKKKFNANIIFADSRNFVISFNEFSVVSGRNILKGLIQYFSHRDSIYANVPFYIKQEYIAACQFDKYNFIRYKEYSNPNEENTDENLKIIEYLPPICESFLRYVLDVITLNPLQDIITMYDKLDPPCAKQMEGGVLTLSSPGKPITVDEQNDKKIGDQTESNRKDEKNYFNMVLKSDKLTDKINLTQKAQLKYIYDNSFDDMDEVCESLALINENVDVLSYKLEEKLKDLWFMPGHIYKKIKKSIKYKKYLVENYWPYDDEEMDEMDESNINMVPFLFPKTLGNLAKRENNWRLEIVKFCIFLMQNDKLLNLENENCNEAFHEKRHELFEIVGDSEYNRKNSLWKSPCPELILKDIFCENCSSVYHMNVVTSLVEAEINGKPSFIWLCKNCNSKYDNDFIELKILSLLQETFDAYNAQDLVCNNCNAIKSFYRRAICKCGQTFTPRLDITNWKRTLEIMENLGTMLNMPILLDVLNSMKTYLV